MVRSPDPNKEIIGMSAMMPISPKMPSRREAKHHNKMVKIATATTNHCVPVRGSSVGRNEMRRVFCELHLNVARRKPQISRSDKMHTGSAITNHSPHDGCGSIAPIAIMF